MLQALVGLGEGLFCLAERGNVGEAHHETAARHGVADQFDHSPIGEQALGRVCPTLAHPVKAAGHMHFRFPGAAQAALCIVANDVGNRAADTDQSFGVVEQFQIAAIPGHQFERLIDYADALGDVLDCALQQCAVELQYFRRFVGDAYDVFELHFPAFNGRFYHCSGRRRAEYPGQ